MSLDQYVTSSSFNNYVDNQHVGELRKRELTLESEIIDPDNKNKLQTVWDNGKKDNNIETKIQNISTDTTDINNNRPLSVSSGLYVRLNSSLEKIKNQSKENRNLRLRRALLIISLILIALIVGLGLFFGLYYGIIYNTKTFSEACSTAQPCVPNKNLFCNVTCTCDAASYWDGFTCTSLLPFGSTCHGGSFQCVTGLSCVNNICQCQNTSYYDGTKCNTKLPYNSVCSSCSYSSCPNCITCSQCQDYANLACNLTTLKCECPFNTSYYDGTTNVCTSKLPINVYCTLDLQCKDVTQGLYCQTLSNMGTSCPSQPLANFCNCPSTTYYNGAICKPYETYYSTCSQNCACNVWKGLYCSAIENRCLCPSNYYWDSTLLNCYKQLTYKLSCSSIKQCDSSLGLTCNSGACECKLFPGTWYWSSIGQYCVECPYDWTIITSGSNVQKCVKVNTYYTSWSNAKINCEEHAGHLAIFNDSSLNLKVKSLITIGSYYLVGATDSKFEGQWTWTYDGQALNTAISGIGWCAVSSEPNGGTVENCVVVEWPTWCFRDIPCTTQSYYHICQKNL